MYMLNTNIAHIIPTSSQYSDHCLGVAWVAREYFSAVPLFIVVLCSDIASQLLGLLKLLRREPFSVFSSPSMVKDNKLRRHKRSVGYLHVSGNIGKYVFRSVSHHYCAIILFQYSYVSVFSCSTPVLLCGNNWSGCTLIVYRDGGSAKEKGKLRNILLYVLYPRLVSVYVNYSLGTPTIFQVLHN